MNLLNHPDDEYGVIAPLTYVTETEGSICIYCHLHGISEEEIRIDLERNQLTLRAAKQDTKYLQKIAVPEGLRITKKRFHDGILEIILEHPS